MTNDALRVVLVLVAWSIAGLALPMRAEAVTVFSADGTELIESDLTPPRHRLAVLFVHDHGISLAHRVTSGRTVNDPLISLVTIPLEATISKSYR